MKQVDKDKAIINLNTEDGMLDNDHTPSSSEIEEQEHPDVLYQRNSEFSKGLTLKMDANKN